MNISTTTRSLLLWLVAITLLSSPLVGFANALSATQPATQPGRPNIVLILADDMGYSDIGCFGSEIATPNIDRLASQGVRMTQFYNYARCCPTRASLMTGLYPHQAGIGHMMEDHGLPAYRGELNDRCVTMAEALGAAGYRTAMAGKWHLCNAVITKPQVNHRSREPFWRETDPTGTAVGTKAGWPRQRGFDSYYGIIIGVADYFDPFTLTRGNDPIFDAPPNDFYMTDAITDEAVAQISARSGKPLFLYVAYTAPHWPLHARPEDIAKYKDRYRDGFAKLRAERHRKQVELGIVDPKWKLPPVEPEVPRGSDEDAEKMAVYAAQIDRLDQGVGKILATLDETKQAKNTLVVFLSDNGGCAETPQAGWFDVTTKTRDGQPVGPNQKPIGSPRSYTSYGPGWAWASNTPFRRYKHFTHEGGISTPLIARWPAKFGHREAPLRDVGHVIDLMPTFLAAAGAAYPERYHGRDITPAEGTSLLPDWESAAPIAPNRALFWEHEGNRAVRKGNWKIVADGPDTPWELYDLAADRTETTNLAAGHADVVKDLSDAYDAWAKRVGVIPWKDLSKPIKK